MRISSSISARKVELCTAANPEKQNREGLVQHASQTCAEGRARGTEGSTHELGDRLIALSLGHGRAHRRGACTRTRGRRCPRRVRGAQRRRVADVCTAEWETVWRDTAACARLKVLVLADCSAEMHDGACPIAPIDASSHVEKERCRRGPRRRRPFLVLISKAKRLSRVWFVKFDAQWVRQGRNITIDAF